MAIYHQTKDFDAFVLTRYEAVQIIARLAAQLGNTHVQQHQAGAAADFISHDKQGGGGRRIVMSVEYENEDNDNED